MSETTITTSSTGTIQEGVILYLTVSDRRLWKWIVAFIFRFPRPMIVTSHVVKSVDNQTTLTIS